MNYDILVYGPLFCDLIFTSLPGMPELGREVFAGDMTVAVGGSAIVAAALHRLGVRVGLIADLGSDPLSQVVRALLDELGLDQTLIRSHTYPLPQVTAALSFPHDRAFVTRFQRPEQPRDIAALLASHSARHMHVCGFLALEETPDIVDLAHDAGMTVSLDLGWDDHALRQPALRDMLALLDIFMPSKCELCAVMGTDDAEEALSRAAVMMPGGIVVMKDGSRGAIARQREVREQVQALLVKAVDTTGAGDSFDAGFLYAYINNLPLGECMRYGNICGGLATTAAGGAVAAPTFEEMRKWL
ncbi:MAG: carbohydrate kinase family protein [Anaerolineae bacterium]|nr:carbohydrate kinase family protein [Anaerolineae bacterium]